MIKPLVLSRNDVLEMIDHATDKLSSLDLVSLTNQFTNSWIKMVGENTFVLTGGDCPDYLASVVDMRLEEKMRLDNQN